MEIIIRKYHTTDIDAMLEIWLQASILAHSFIPKEIWENELDAMRCKYLPNSDNTIAIYKGNVVGFVAMIENHIAAIFVHPNMQNKGIGKALLNHVKSENEILTLNVFAKNKSSIGFYEKQNFFIKETSLNSDFNEDEHLMIWNKNYEN